MRIPFGASFFVFVGGIYLEVIGQTFLKLQTFFNNCNFEDGYNAYLFCKSINTSLRSKSDEQIK